MQAWLKTRYRLRPSEAKRDLELAALLARSEQDPSRVDNTEDQAPREGAAVADALWGGAVQMEQAKVIGHALDELPADASVQSRVLAEQIMVEQAADHDPATLTRLGHRILEAVDPDAADRHLEKVLEREAREAERLRSATRFSDGHGSVFYKFRIPVGDDAHVWPVLDALAAPAPEADTVRDQRAPQQRLADAFLEALRRVSLDGGLPQAGGDRPRALITMNLDQLNDSLRAGTLVDTGEQLAPSAVRRLCCDAELIPMVLGTAGAILDLGRAARCFTGPVRLAVIARDQGCIHPGCERPPRWCDVHHVIAWWRGGRTNLGNGVLLCGYHHKLHERAEWQIRFAADGIPECIPPSWVRADGRPIRHTRYLTRL